MRKLARSAVIFTVAAVILLTLVLFFRESIPAGSMIVVVVAIVALNFFRKQRNIKKMEKNAGKPRFQKPAQELEDEYVEGADRAAKQNAWINRMDEELERFMKKSQTEIQDEDK